MKITAFIALVACIVAVCSPFQLTLSPFACGQCKKAVPVLTINVCHASGDAPSPQAGDSFVMEVTWVLPDFDSFIPNIVSSHLFNLPPMSFRPERPPEA
ncbi:MAG: hypothetical protein HQL08_13590 [Nitrospirae bacterium]|nr:hypothetical protein [Nitrospirota bacterium]